MNLLRSRWSWLGALVVGLVALHLRLRLRIVDPSNFNWLWSGDWANAASGFLFFVQETWTWPLGKMESLLHPFGTSIGFTDSIPWLAIFFKIFSPWLPFPFHYLGIWFLICFTGQSLVSFLIFKKLGLKLWQSYLGAFVLALSPPLLYRIGHVSLCGHFLILFQIYLFIGAKKDKKIGRALIFSLLGVLAASGVHPYLWAMALLVSFSLEMNFICETWGKADFKKKIRVSAVSAGAKVGLSYLALLSIGYFLPSDKDHGGFSYYKGDLTAFFNPMGEKTFLPRISASAGQYEAYAYLGLGSILLLILILFTKKGRSFLKDVFRNYGTLAFCCFLAWVYSLSAEISFAGRSLIDLSGLYRLLGPIPNTFRSAGRFSWPLYYLITLFLWSFAFHLFQGKKRWVVTLLGIIQFFDLFVFYDNLPPEHPRPAFSFETEFKKLRSQYNWKKMVVLPQSGWGKCQRDPGFSFDQKKSLVYFAALHGLQTNMGDVSRFPKKSLEEECERSRQELLQDRPVAENLYIVFHSEWKDLFSKKPIRVRCHESSNLRMCWKPRLGP